MKRISLILLTALVVGLWVLHDFASTPAADHPAASLSGRTAEGPSYPAAVSSPTGPTTPATGEVRNVGDVGSAPVARPIAWQMVVSLADALEPLVLPVLVPHAPAPPCATTPGAATVNPATQTAVGPALATPLQPDVAPMPRAPLSAPAAPAALATDEPLADSDAQPSSAPRPLASLPPGQTIDSQLDSHSPAVAASRGNADGRWQAALSACGGTLSGLSRQAIADMDAGTAWAQQQLRRGAEFASLQLEAWRKAAAEAAPVVAVVPGHSPLPTPSAVASDSPPNQPPARPDLSPEMQELEGKVHQALELYRHDRLLNTGSQSPWEVMHRIVAYGIPTEIRRDGPSGDRLNAIGWLLYGGRCTGQPLVVLTGTRPTVMVGPGVQGHPGQFLGMLAQSHVSPDSPFQLGGRSFTVRDLIEEEKATCDPQLELTFKLIALSYYLKSDDQWTSRDGQPWSISRLVQEEIRQPIRGAACGGTHRLFGLSSSYKMRIRDGFAVDGQFRRAQIYIRDYQRYALGTLHNRDGSFSTDWFARPADSGDMARKIQTSGHILEWLVFSLEEDQLQDPRVVETVDFLATTLVNSPDRDWSVGPLGHALHALMLYDERVFRPAHGISNPQVAARGDLGRGEHHPSTAAPAAKPPLSGPSQPPVWDIPLGPNSGAASRSLSPARAAALRPE